MRKFKLKFHHPRQLRNLLVMSLLSFVVALPMLGQPLGLINLWSAPVAAPVADGTRVQPSEAGLHPAEIDLGDAALNRSQSEYTPSDPSSANVPSAGSTADGSPVTTDSPAAAVLTDKALAVSLATAGIIAPLPAGPLDLTDLAGDALADLVPVDYRAYVKASVLNVRVSPDADAARLTRLEMGDKLSCIGETGEWLQVMVKDEVGFVRAEFISRAMVFVPDSNTVYVKSTLNLRKTYSKDGAVLARLSANTRLTRLGVGDGWSRVRTTSGKIGYVASAYLTTQKPKVSSSGSSRTRTSSSDSSSGDAPSSSVGDQVVYYAKQALGTPYVYGGESLSGMDCSGLVYWCYRKAGISVPRSSGSYGSAGVGVSLANAEPGDVICLDTKNDGKTSISHLAIYVGGGRIIHASSGHDCVRYSTIATMRDCGYTIVSVRRIAG